MIAGALRRGGWPATLALLAASASCATNEADAPARRFEALRRQYVELFLQQHPSLATDLGMHQHDSRLVDLSARALTEGARQFETLLERLREIDPGSLAQRDQIDFALLEARLRAVKLERREIRVHETNPMIYPLEISLGLLSLVARPFASVEQRMRAAIGRLQAVPALLQAGRQNLKAPPELFTRVALDLTRSASDYVAHEYSGAFGPVKNLELRADFETSRAEAASALRAFESWLETDLLPRSDGDFALGLDRLTRKLQYEEMLDIPVHRMLAWGEAELAHQREELLRVASEFRPGAGARGALAVLVREHPSRGEVLEAATEWMLQARQFVADHGLLTLPDGPVPQVRETPPFLRSTFASMNAAGPFEASPLHSYYYLTPPDPDWPRGRVEAYLKEFNHWLLAIVTLHETYPGHYVQALAQRQTGSLLRRVVPVGSYAEGWAHYCEQMMLEEGYGDGDVRLRLAQLKDSLLRLCRLVAAVRLHTRGMTLDEATRLFIEEAFMEPLPARQEAERGAYDPGYLVYALGKMQILKLREDLRALQGEQFTLRDFHDRLLSEGELPIPLLRRILLPEHAGTSL